MAEIAFRNMAETQGLDVEVASAGVVAGDGNAASENAKKTVAEAKLSLDDFRSSELTLPRIRKANLIVGMSKEHVQQVCRLAPDACDRTILLTEVLDQDEGIPDPVGQDLNTFRACFTQMRPALQALIDRIKKNLKEKEMRKAEGLSDFFDTDYKIVIGSDHGGYELKNALVEHLQSKGIEVEDVGPHSFNAQDDYPDFAGEVGKKVSEHENRAGILICRSGIGMSINANRFHNVRAALVKTPKEASVSRSHNCSNVLVAGGNDLTDTKLTELTDTWLNTPFSKEQRHIRRLLKIEENSENARDPIEAVDPEIGKWLDEERMRQSNIIELIASENLVSPAIRAATGSCLTNKYAEGYPHKRYYGGCEYVDEVERLAIERACSLFNAEAANVQPHSGSQANMAAYFALLEPGDTVLGMSLDHGGHLTHGLKINFSGRLFNFVSYGVSEESETIDYDEVERLALEHQPRLVLAGASAYPRTIDFPRLRAIADKVNAYLMVDMAHIAGLVATGVHPSPVPDCDIVTTTTHKTLRGPRSGLILCKQEHIKKINTQVFPGLQGGPLMHVIAAKAICFREAMSSEFRNYAKQVVVNAQTLAGALADHGLRIVSGGTDNHLMLVDLRSLNVTGKVAELALDEAGITTNKNLIPFDSEKPTVTSGLRLGTPTITTRGMGEAEMVKIGEWIHRVLANIEDETVRKQVREEVLALTSQFPVP